MKLGRSELEVSRLTLGTWAFAGGQIWGEQERRESVSTVHAALDAGINFFDTAPAYGAGKSEEVLGEALQGRRGEAVIATKVSTRQQGREALLKSCEESLARLKTDYIDLLQVHWPSPDVPFREIVATFAELKHAGKIRYAGVCNFSARDISRWLDAGGEMVTNQLPYSLLTRAIEFEIISACEKRGIATLPYSPLMQGLLTGKFRTADDVPDGRSRSRHFRPDRPMARHGEPGCEGETFAAIKKVEEIAASAGQPMDAVSLAWILAQPTVGSVVFGARTVEQLKANIRGMEIELSSETVSELTKATEAVKDLLGANPDIWENPSRFNL
ncbi:MAG: aldo/keto reductase [Puniceicoccaceae bacterium]